MADTSYDDAFVDGRFVRVGAKSYAVDKITSVEVRTGEQQPNKKGATLLAIAGLIAVFAAIQAPVLLVLATGVGLLANRAYKVELPRQHRVILMLASQEAAALETTDRTRALGFRDEIERAMVAAA